MSKLVFVVGLVAVWLGLNGTVGPYTVGFGLVLALLVRRLFNRAYEARTGYLARDTRVRPLAMLLLVLFFVREVLASAWRVALVAVRPRLDIRPGILAVPVAVSTDVQLAVLANLVSLTPGTLSLDVSPEGDVLYVHALDVEGDGEDIRRAIEQRLERRVIAALPAARTGQRRNST